MAHLSKPQIAVLALWSFDVVIARSCGLTTVTCLLAQLVGAKEAAMRERLQDLYREAAAKKGQKRAEWYVESCFGPLLGWILSWWRGESHRLALVLDATTLSDRLVVLAISVVYRGCAIPVAWEVVEGQRRGSWRPFWEQLLDRVAAAIPPDWFVLVLADRGLYAPWLFQRLQRRGWHPFRRINAQGLFRPQGEAYRPLGSLGSQPGTAWAGVGICFKGQPLACTLLAVCGEASQQPWFIVTDLPVAQADAAWYGLRPWIESGFKDLKRGGWQWHQTRITNPRRTERFWLVLAVATLWVVSVGGEADATQPVHDLDALPEPPSAHRRATHRSRPRLLGCFRQGLLIILAALLRGRPLPLGHFCPHPWPSSPQPSEP